MTWQSQKKILLAVAVILIALLSFAIGVSFGTSYDKGSLIDVMFPALGVVGNWIAGIGAVAAVFTSLWLADNQRKLNTEDIEIKLSLVVSPPDMTSRLMVSAVSKGNRPANLKSLSIYSTNSTVAMWVKDLDPQSSLLPIVLPYGHDASFLLVQGTESYINNYVEEHCGGEYAGLRMQLNTTLGTFFAPFSREIIEHLRDTSANKSSQGMQQSCAPA
ncbi:hypothetical protein KUV89_09135 [Marinobacter hydrocarbonoclasticus]|nr:hypothetical protein [Marinobacter nauticus]